MAMTTKQKEERWRQFVDWYRVNISGTFGADPKGHPIPATLKKLYMANDGSWGTDRAMMWIRLHDPNYIRTKAYRNKEDALKSLYEKAYGYKINWSKPEMKKYLDAFGRTNPNINVDRRLTEIFMKRILPSAEFKKTNPSFAAWLGKNRQVYQDASSIIAALTDYNAQKEKIRDYWAQSSTLPINKDLLNAAMANDWDTDSQAFQMAMRSTPEWSKGASYQDRAAEFKDNWQAIFGEGKEVDQEMMDKYSRSASGEGFADYFNKTLKKSEVFKDAMPGYTSWEAAQHAAGTPEGGVDIFDYFSRRTELVEMWNQNFTGGELPDQALIDRAMKENWGDALFQNKLRATPQYSNSGEGKDKAARFDSYWRGMFGEGVVPDESIRSRFVGSTANDPAAFWDDIKNTEAFKKQFSNWDVFSRAQTSVGATVVNDPQTYNQYKGGLEKAFQDIGMEVPPGLDRTIFASGISTSDLQERANLWKTTEQAFKKQTGQEADLAKTLGIAGNKAQAGDMRLRMQKAVEQQRALAKSKFASVSTNKNQDTGFIKQNI